MQEFPGAIPQDAIDYIEQKWGFDWKNWSALDATQRLVLTTAVQNAIAHNMSVTTKAVLDELEAGLNNPANTGGAPGAHVWPPHWTIPQDAIDHIEQKWGFDWKNWIALDATQRLALTTAVQKVVAHDTSATMQAVLADLESQLAPEPFLAGLDNPVGPSGVQDSVPGARPGDPEVWPFRWQDINPIGNFYTFNSGRSQAWHTGADLNLNYPRWDADKHAPVYAIGDGVVTCARRLPDTWGNVIVIQHDSPPVYSRYAHLDNMTVSEGDRVKRGEQIGRIGDSFGILPFHLHFDISLTGILGQRPGHWPGMTLRAVVAHYVEPKSYIRLWRPGATPPGDSERVAVINDGTRFRTGPTVRFKIYSSLARGTTVTRLAVLDNWALCQMNSGEYGWIRNDLINLL